MIAKSVPWPSRDELRELTEAALRDLGGRAERRQIKARAIELGRFSDAQRAEPGPRSKQPMTKLEYQLGWAIDSLHKRGAIKNPRRGCWELVRREQS